MPKIGKPMWNGCRGLHAKSNTVCTRRSVLTSLSYISIRDGWCLVYMWAPRPSKVASYFRLKPMGPFSQKKSNSR